MIFSLRTALVSVVTAGGLLGVSQHASWAQPLPPVPVVPTSRAFSSPIPTGGVVRTQPEASCQGEQPLTALSELRNSGLVGNVTSQANPTLLFFYPNVDEAAAAFLQLSNQRQELIYENGVIIPESAGVIALPIPIDLPPGQAFQWTLELACETEGSVVVSGWVERQLPNADHDRTLRQALSINRAALYANYGYLQDTLSELATLRLANPDSAELTAAWVRLLSEIGHAAVAAEPILECCELGAARDAVGEESEEENEEPDVDLPAVEPEETVTEDEAEGDRRSVLERARDRGN